MSTRVARSVAARSVAARSVATRSVAARSVAARSVAARSIAAAARGTRRSSSSALRLGDLQLKSDVLLAPLERVSDVGFRRLCFRHGAALTWTEMVYASDLARGKTASCDLIDTHDPSTLTGVQILVDRTTARDGWGVDCLRAALEALEAGAAGARPEWRNIRAIDLNFGCPDPAVSARGAGPAQLRRRSKVQRSRERRRTYHHGAGFGVTMESQAPCSPVTNPTCPACDPTSTQGTEHLRGTISVAAGLGLANPNPDPSPNPDPDPDPNPNPKLKVRNIFEALSEWRQGTSMPIGAIGAPRSGSANPDPYPDPDPDPNPNPNPNPNPDPDPSPNPNPDC
jgi:hypothetical protein